MISPVRLPGIFYPWCYLHVHIARIGDIFGVHVRPPFAKARTLFLADKYLEMKVLNVKQNMKVERQACITVRLRDYIAE